MTKAIFYASLALLTAFLHCARAATVEDSFRSIVSRAKRLNQTPAQSCNSDSCWRAWRILNRHRAMLAIERLYNGGGGVKTACWTGPADYSGSMTCMTTRGENFTMSSGGATIWSDRIAQANTPTPPAPPPSVNLDLKCSAPVMAKGDAEPGRNPVVAAARPSRSGRVVDQNSKLADGSSVDRADQYNGASTSASKLAETNATAKQPAIAQWAGMHKRRADVVMIGSLYQVDPVAYRYVEVVASTKRLGDAKVMVATCAPMQSVSTTPSAAATPAITAAPPPAPTPPPPPSSSACRP